ncbi:alpha/beta hydrolase fold protein [Xylariaceae sp. FL1651]|nr:alpha/beta hydrolase fold protein [Xylariaceae sp. FL1651]
MTTETSFIRDTQAQLPLLSRLYHGASINAAQSLYSGVLWAREWYRWFYPPDLQPNFIKTYECRPKLPISIFFPKAHDQTSPQTLPTIFMIHGGGFCVGSPGDDDVWNERFASMHNVLVVELNYRKAPAHPFPTATYDLEALMLAVFNDESLPIDKSRIAVGGFSAGGNLALSVCQLPSIREKVKPAAAVAVYPSLDQTLPSSEKIKCRYYKPDLKTGMRANTTDFLAGWSPTFRWSYIPIGHDLRDPLLSVYFAPRENLPPHIFLVGAELDQLSHEAWRMANKLAGRPIPALTEKVGQEKPASNNESLILDDERFAFGQLGADGKRSVQWLLVPDEVHGFDHIPPSYHGSEEAMRAAHTKTLAYQKLVGEWLYSTVWKS